MLRRWLAFLPMALVGAQDLAAPLRHVPADAVAVLRLRGPAAFGAALAGTGLGKAFAAEAMLPHWRRLVAAAAEQLALDAATQTAAAALWQRLVGYRGEVVLALTVDRAALAASAGAAAPPLGLTLLLGGDGATDLDALRQELDALLPQADRTEVELAGERRAALPAGPGTLLLPFRHGDLLVAGWSPDLVRHLEPLLAAGTEPFALAEAERTAPLAMHANLDAGLHAALRALWQAEAPPAVAAALGAAVPERLTGFRYRLFAEAAWVAQEAVLEFGGEARGLLPLLLPLRRTQPSLLAVLPQSAENFEAAHHDWQGVFAFAMDVLRKLGDDAPITPEQLAAQVQETVKLRLQEDLVDLFGTQWLRIYDFAAQADLEGEEDENVDRLLGEYGDTVYVFELRDGARLQKNVDTALRARGLHVGRKREDYEGTAIFRMNLLGAIPLEYAFAGDVLVLGLGSSEGTQRHLRGVLDQLRARAAGGPTAELPTGARQRLQGLPEDWSGIAVGSWLEILDGMVGNLGAAVALADAAGAGDDEEVGLVRLGSEALRALRTGMQGQGAGVSIEVGYSSADRYVLRSRW